MALGSTYTLTEMCTRNIHVPNVMKSESLNLLETSGLVQGTWRTSLPILLPIYLQKRGKHLPVNKHPRIDTHKTANCSILLR
jgi:hypothetical protein